MLVHLVPRKGLAPPPASLAPALVFMWEGPNASEKKTNKKLEQKRTWKESRKKGAGVLGPVAFSWPRLPTPPLAPPSRVIKVGGFWRSLTPVKKRKRKQSTGAFGPFTCS